MGLFTADQAVVSAGALYLRIAGPTYALYGLGMAIYFAMQGYGNVVAPVAGNALRLAAGAGGALVAVAWLGTGPLGAYAAIASAFVIYGTLNAYLLWRR
jgi:Na+-driven multidrug efflux pump